MKEQWNEYFRQGKFVGMSDDDAALFADKQMAEYQAYMTDKAKNERKDRMLHE